MVVDGFVVLFLQGIFNLDIFKVYFIFLSLPFLLLLSLLKFLLLQLLILLLFDLMSFQLLSSPLFLLSGGRHFSATMHETNILFAARSWIIAHSNMLIDAKSTGLGNQNTSYNDM